MVIQLKSIPKRSLIQSAVYAAVGLAASRAGAQDPATFDFTGGAQTYVVPTTGDYDLAAYGGQGGFATFDGTAGGPGGRGRGLFQPHRRDGAHD